MIEPEDYAEELNQLSCRDYQRTAVISAFNCWGTASATVINLATGLGKTRCGTAICHVWSKYKPGRILWIAHRKELIGQAADTIASLTGHYPETEMGDKRATSYGLLADSNVVVASIQTLNAGYDCKYCDATGGVLAPCDKCDGKGCDDPACEGRGTVATEVNCPFCLGGTVRRVQKFKPDEFGLIVVDEAHHVFAQTHIRVRKWFERNENAKFLYLTATADRADEGALGPIFKTVAIKMPLLDGIEKGYLVPITQQSITCEHLDFSHLRTAKDFNDKNIEEVLIAEETLHEMVAPTVEITGDRRTLIFCVDKTHTKMVCELINRYKPNSARYVLGCTATDVRDKNIAGHKAGVFQYLVNCGIATEGYDDVGIQCVAIMRPTKSRPLYEQMIGRAVRPKDNPTQATAEERKAVIAASTKPVALILDFAGNSGRHKLITVFDMFEGRYPAELLDRAKRISEETNEELSTDELLKRAAAQLEEEEQRRKEESEAKRKAHLKAREAKYQTQNVDPFAWWDTLPDRIGAEKRGEPATDKQIGALAIMGVEGFKLTDISKSQASVMLETLADRKKKGLASYKQAKLLKKNGMNPDIKFAEARQVIDALAANGWRPTDAIRAMAPLNRETV